MCWRRGMAGTAWRRPPPPATPGAGTGGSGELAGSGGGVAVPQGASGRPLAALGEPGLLLCALHAQ